MVDKIYNFTDLNAWKLGHELVLDVYKCTATFPVDERFCLTDQMRRAAISVTSNIAEGFSRKSTKEKLQFYKIALGSLTELQSQLMIARDVGYLELDFYGDLFSQSVIVQKLIFGLSKYQKSKEGNIQYTKN